MDDAITLDKKILYALRRSIIYINVCKKSFFKGIRKIYLLTFVLDPLYTQISVVFFCLLYETAAKTGFLRFFSRISNRIQNYATWQNPLPICKFLSIFISYFKIKNIKNNTCFFVNFTTLKPDIVYVCSNK